MRSFVLAMAILCSLGCGDGHHLECKGVWGTYRSWGHTQCCRWDAFKNCREVKDAR
jgi:hypothetical protein